MKQWPRPFLFGLHLFSLKCSTDLLPGSHGNECWYHNPRTVRTNEVCPEVEGTGPEIEAIQVGSNEVNQASIELTQADSELKNMAVGLPGCNSVAASSKLLVRWSKSYIINPKSHNPNNCKPKFPTTTGNMFIVLFWIQFYWTSKKGVFRFYIDVLTKKKLWGFSDCARNSLETAHGIQDSATISCAVGSIWSIKSQKHRTEAFADASNYQTSSVNLPNQSN